MHHKRLNLRYLEAEGFQWLELPYKGDRLSMVLMLPQKKGQLRQLEKKLTAAAVQKSLANLSPRDGTVALPRFKAKVAFDLGAELKAMGMPAAFSHGVEFSGIAPQVPLWISWAFHQGVIEVDEAGTEAAAATALGFAVMGSKPFVFRADQPFLFLIRDGYSGTILFQGRVSDP